MRKFSFLVLAILVLASPLFAQDAQAAEPWYSARFKALGFIVPPRSVAIEPVAFKTLEGVDTSPALGRGKISILNFWAT